MGNTVDELLQEIENLNNKRDHKASDAVYEQQWQAVEQKMDELMRDHELNDFTQDQMIKFLDLTRNMSWDIPSALMALCSHLDEDEYYFMHRLTAEERKKYDEKYPQPAPSGWAGPAGPDRWAPADKHFTEVHGWDMSDKRINWSFDT